MPTWQPSIASAAFMKAVCLDGWCLLVFQGLQEMDDLVANGPHLLSDSVDDTVDSGTRDSTHSEDHPA